MEDELTPEALDAWERACEEIARRGEIMEQSMSAHYARPENDERPAAPG